MFEWIAEHVHAYAVWLSIILVFCGIAIWRIQADQTQPYDIVDIFIDPNTGKASLDKHILLLMALLSAWTVVVLVLKGMAVETLLIGVLGVFVLQRGVRDGLALFKGKANDKEPK